MFGLPGGTEWLIIGLIALLLFGKRLPEVMRSLGRGISEFKRGMSEVTDELEDLKDATVSPPEIEAPQETVEDAPTEREHEPDSSAADEGADPAADIDAADATPGADTRDGKAMAG